MRTSDGSPARLTVSRSKDGIHFAKSEWSSALTSPYSGPPARDPIVFRDPATNLFHMLVTTELTESVVARRNGCLAHLISRDLREWEQREPYLLPGFTGQPECADWFEWNGWCSLIFSNHGVARYRMSKKPHGPWSKPKFDVFDGPQARVLKTAAFTGNRRLGAAFLTQASSGYAGAFGVCVRGSARYEKGRELRFEPDREKVVWRNSDADTVEEHEHSALYGVEGLDRPFEIEVIVKDDLLDGCRSPRRYRYNPPLVVTMT